MKRRKAVSRINVMPSRSLGWAEQLRQRYARFTDFSRLSLLLYVPAFARTLVSLRQCWLTSPVSLHPQLNLSLKRPNVVNTWTNNVSTSQMTLLSFFALANVRERAGKSESATPLKRYVRDDEMHQRLGLTLAVNRTSTDLATTLSQKFQVQREAKVREISTLLTQRLKRINEPSAVPAPMAFRAAVTNRVTAAEPSVELMRSREALERRSTSPGMPSIAPPALNVEMLTNEVMKQIDRRVTARRERMGQI